MSITTKNSNIAQEKNTFFAPAIRATDSELTQLAEITLQDPIVHVILESVHGYVMILNEQRQIVAANNELLNSLKAQKGRELLGCRPGEALSCVHATDGPDLCGTSVYCRHCGAVLALLSAQQNKNIVDDECNMMVKRNNILESFEFHVRITPLLLAGRYVYIFVLYDISALKRREILEHIFLHDLRNLITGLQGYGDLLMDKDVPLQEISKGILSITNRLRNDIDNQYLIHSAEKGTLKVQFDYIDLVDIYLEIQNIFKNHESAKDKNLHIKPIQEKSLLYTDRAILVRILVNMILNACEASREGDTVNIWHEFKNGRDIFYVKNMGVIPEKIAQQIFQRSFSTKAKQGRGIGTYSMKVLAHNYLKGSINFISDEANGTVFRLRIDRPHPKVDQKVSGVFT